MRACVRCGAWHTLAEEYAGRYLSCTEVKQFWSDVKRLHLAESGHLAALRMDKNGHHVVCVKCGKTVIHL